jgi:hypothetical protein
VLLIRDSWGDYQRQSWRLPGLAGVLPSWSPDGKLLAFTGIRDQPLGVWVLDTELRRAVRLSAEPSSRPSWSLDGAFLTYDDCQDLAPRTVPTSIWKVSTAVIRQHLPSGLTEKEFMRFVDGLPG